MARPLHRYLEDPYGGAAPATPGSSAALAEELYPEERLAFALGDGRVGVLAVCGRKVSHLSKALFRHSMLRAVQVSGKAVSGRVAHDAFQVEP